jgi:hypothetical protein
MGCVSCMYAIRWPSLGNILTPFTPKLFLNGKNNQIVGGGHLLRNIGVLNLKPELLARFVTCSIVPDHHLQNILQVWPGG